MEQEVGNSKSLFAVPRGGAPRLVELLSLGMVMAGTRYAFLGNCVRAWPENTDRQLCAARELDLSTSGPSESQQYRH